MKFKGTIIIMVLTSAVTWLVFSIASNQNKSQDSKQTAQVQGDQSTADHHGGSTPVSSTTFDKLVGKKALDFTLESYNGEKITLSSLKGKTVVLFFSEGLMCYPACWNQIAAFGKDQRFKNENTLALTIVNDKKEEWKSAIDKMPELVSAAVLFDTSRSVSNAYGVLSLPSSMHRGQLPGHSYVIVDKSGTIRFAKDDAQMAVRNDSLISEIQKL